MRSISQPHYSQVNMRSRVQRYLVTRKWNKDLERCIIWNDRDIGINWPLNNKLPLISAKDSNGMTLSKAKLSGNIL